MTSSISNQEIIPVIESSIFVGQELAHLAVGIIAIGNKITPGYENEYKGYALLRGNVYAHQRNYMPISDLNDDGTETDPDDARAVHFAVFENSSNRTRVVGAMRLIVKDRQDDLPLPIEQHYPDAFSSGPATAQSSEVSRLIGRHESGRVQSALKWLIFSAGVSYGKEHNLGPIYGAVERSLFRGLGMAGVPVEALGEPVFVEEFNSSKLPIRIDIAGLEKKIENVNPGLVYAMQHLNKKFIYSGTVKTNVSPANVTAA